VIGVDTTFLIDFEHQESVRHENARAIYGREVVQKEESLVIAPQVLMEFLHAITDARRFSRPLTMPESLERAIGWWRAPETVGLHSTDASFDLFLRWMREHRLGRKRILDTHLAAALHHAGVTRLLTSNPADFETFGVFELIVP
jgi:predicted nucleic acid-binding protein